MENSGVTESATDGLCSNTPTLLYSNISVHWGSESLRRSFPKPKVSVVALELANMKLLQAGGDSYHFLEAGLGFVDV